MKLTYFQSRDHWRTRAFEWIQYALAWCFQKLTSVLPLWRVSGAVAWAGKKAVMLIPGLRKRAMRNIERVWPDCPEDRQRQIVRGATSHFLHLAVEYAHLKKFVRKVQIDVDGIEHLQAARDASKGAVLVTAHYGNWEAARLAALNAGFPTGIIFRRFNNRYLTRYTLDLIKDCGDPVLTKGRSGMRKLVSHVARGGFVMILVDQRNSGAPFLDFLGHPAETVTAAADLAHRTGAALIPVRGIRDIDKRRFDVRFEAPITGDDPTAMMQKVNDRISDWITEYPEQWLWFHRRWRSTLRSRPQLDPNAVESA